MDLIMDFDIKGGDFVNAGISSTVMKQYLKRLGIDAALIRRILIAAYEAELNVVAHAYEGKLSLFLDEDEIVVTVIDKGPGIENIELAMQEGYSTASDSVREMGFGAGMGLPNIKKNSDKMEIESEVGKGTSLTLHFKLG